MVGIALASCDSGNKRSSIPTEYDEEDETALPYGATDTIEGEAVSTDCAKINFELERLQSRIDNVQSPDMLMYVKADFERLRDSLTLGTNGLAANEKEIITSACNKLNSSYEEVCRKYEIPADGVISNLNNCIQQIGRAQNRSQFMQVTDCRRGMLRHLDIIHLCVESKSSRLGEVKRLAAQLQKEYDQQKRRFGVN